MMTVCQSKYIKKLHFIKKLHAYFQINPCNIGITSIDYSHIVLIIAIWPGDRIRRPEHSTVEHGSCDESV